jgi:hypothetical protein
VLRTAAQVEAQEKTRKTRRVYPYSIVPGGLADRRELARAVVIDKVVAEHYAAFETARATVKTVDKPRAVYVSYRKGDKVFWTAKKLQLAEGETLLSDGQNEIRTRCGNRISDVPQLPVEAKAPSEEELDSSVEAAEDDAGEGTVTNVGFSVDGNPAGHGYQLKTFGSGSAAQNGGTRLTRTGVGMPSPGSGLGSTWAGGTLPLALDGKVSGDASGTGSTGTSATGTSTGTTGSGTPGTGTSGTGTSGTGTPVSGTSGTGTSGTSGTGTPGTSPSGTGTSGTGTSWTGATKPGGTKPGGPKTTTPTTGTPATGVQPPAAPVTNGSDSGNTGDVKTGGTGGTTPDSGSPAGGTQPSPVPGTLLPPTTDLPGPTSNPAKTPVKHADVPEPGTLWLAGAGVAALLASRRAKKRTRD